MAINVLEANLQAISNTIAILEKSENVNPKKIQELKKEREKILKELNIC